MISRTFSVKGLDKADFDRLVLFSRYLGESEKGKEFELDVERARLNRVNSTTIKETLERLGVKLSEGDLKFIEKELSDFKVSFEIMEDKLIIKPHVYISDIFKKYRIKIPYDTVRKFYITKPYYYYIIKKILEREGLKVEGLALDFQKLDMKMTLRLRDYQIEAISAWKESGFRGVIALPTGAGKTLVGIGGIVEARSPTLIVTFTREQLMQWKESIEKYTEGHPEVGLYYSREKEISPITVTTYQTAIKHMGELSKFQLLIIDEAHHLPADKFRSIALGSIAPYRMALSATPYRSDGKHVELFKLMGGLVYYKSIDELVSKGYLAKFKLVRIKVPLTPQEKVQYDELMRKYRTLSLGKPIQEIVKMANRGDVRAMDALRIYSKIKSLTGLTRNKLLKIKEIVNSEKDKKIIVFTQYVDHAEVIAKAINGKLLTGQMSKNERQRVFSDFKNVKSGVIVLTTVGDEGLDIPDASVGILVAGTSSRRQFVQRLGRLLRNSSGDKVAVLYELVAQGTSEEYQSKMRRSERLDDVFYGLDS
ncbi:DEAD/DEAH box helicase [Metallosphaera tengchongensis]|uniref:DNA 3'-5' helicase n=1 Tax=Metallosphaera tengchongensis TaxID=1532350 RepID=A0A6N0NR82_9CREN|nr:DEAD/DEAH box helicase [Metallosphaera tengchongensis]QKQ99383.1 DEAD/DEAH box helicase [Metallosphaera tengchongensis]